MQSWTLQGRALGGEMKWRERKISTGDGKDLRAVTCHRDEHYDLCSQPLRQGRLLRAMPLWGRKLRLPPARSLRPRQPYSLPSSVGSRCGHSAQGLTVYQALGAPSTRAAGLCPRSSCQETRDKSHRSPRENPQASPYCPALARALRGWGKKPGQERPAPGLLLHLSRLCLGRRNCEVAYS